MCKKKKSEIVCPAIAAKLIVAGQDKYMNNTNDLKTRSHWLLNDNTEKEKQIFKPFASVSMHLLFNNYGDLNIIILFFQDIK